MSRINTNVSSLIAQKVLGRNNAKLQLALDRLSTGLRINSGKDDPAGLIASENLRRDITAANKAITNTERANQLIATADSALAQISNLLNDVRGLVVEAANTGVLSDEQIAANQLQVDSSLEAIDRIAQVTTFQGRKILDGSLDFQVAYTAGSSTVLNLNIDQANFGTLAAVDVDITITTAATQALITNGGFDPSAATQASGLLALTTSAGSINVAAAAAGAADGALGNATDIVFQAAADIAQAAGTLDLTANTGGSIDLAAVAGGAADGLIGDGVSIVIDESASPTSASYDAGLNQITINVLTGDTVQDIADAINADLAGVFATTGVTSGASVYNDLDSATINGALSGGDDGTTGAVYAGNVITVDVGIGASLNDVAAAIDALADFTSTAASGAANDFDSADFQTFTNPLTGGVDANVNDVLAADLVVKIAGSTGSEVFTFEAGATLAQVVNAVNLVSDATSVAASDNGGVLELRSTDYGSNAVVDVEVLEEGTGGGFEAGLSDTRAEGTDIAASVNGVTANGRGNSLSINTTTLDLSLTVSNGSSTSISFTIAAGGAVFQLGPQVVSNQQARIGIGSVNTGELGGVSGRLYQLRSGNDSDLRTDTHNASLIVDASINKVTGLRGRLGAFQRTTLETNIASLQDTVTNLAEAESSIRDADFAQETANLTKAQILVQSGTAVLQIANQNPQNVLA
ncbi:MAG: flagellin, partial [Pirellulaceae bacterium]